MKLIDHCCGGTPCGNRRHLLGAGLGLAATALLGAAGAANAASLSQAQRDAMTPDQVIAAMKRGNLRFRSGKMQAHDYLAQKRSSAAGQYPAAAILGCIDSRAPAEIVLDAGIGDTFNARVAGNIVNGDMLGSLEFACAASGAKLVLVLGHTACGAIKGAIDGVQLGNLTGLLDKIKPAVAATRYDGERSSKNDAFVDAVAVSNVRLAIGEIRKGSEILTGLEMKGQIRIVGAMYDLKTGAVEFLA